MTPVQLRILLGLGLAVLTTLCFSPVLGNDFIDLDDRLYITQNPAVLAGLTADSFAWAWTHFLAGYWHPLTVLSLELNTELFGTGPVGFHVVNVVLHLANVLLLFWALQRMTGSMGCSALVAGLVAVHPMHVESVAWAAERKDVLSSFFWMLTLCFYARHAESPSWTRFIPVAVCMGLGLLAKPMLVTLPFALLLLDYWPLGRFPFAPDRGLPRASAGWLVLEKTPLFLLALAASVVTIYAHQQEGALSSLEKIPLEARLANALNAYLWYLQKTLWPIGLGIHYTHPFEAFEVGPALLSLAVLIGVTVLFVRLRSSMPELLVGWWWFLGTLVPVLGLVQGGMQAMADRFSYIPHVGLFIVLVWGGAALARRWHVPQKAQCALGLALLGVLAGISFVQVGYWRDTLTIWEHTLAVTTGNDRAHAHLGLYHLAKGDLDKASTHLEESIRLRQNFDTHYNLGLVRFQQGKIDEAAVSFQEAVSLSPNFADGLNSLGRVEILQKKIPEAIKHFQKALELQPGPEIHYNLGFAYLSVGQKDQAESHFQSALALKPNNADAHLQMGLLYLPRGKLDKAAHHFVEAIASKKDFAQAHSNLGLVQSRLGKHREAVANLEKAVQINPRDPSFRVRLGIILSKSGDKTRAQQAYGEADKLFPGWTKEISALAFRRATQPGPQFDPTSAQELAQATCEATHFKNADLVDVLAVAYASLGNFEEAIRLENQALSLTAKDSAPAKKFEERRRMFQKGVSVVQPVP